jgi:crotonobetainyl-CoA:carnitine CoA-transferase CaiB-like acyl-CoA transferase
MGVVLAEAAESVKAVNPDIVYARISGFGQSGPSRERAGVVQIIQGMRGLMSITGEPGRGPMRVGIAISDTSAGMFLGQGILLALLHRERTGEGQWVHTSLLEAMLCKLDFQAARYTMAGDVPTQQGNDHPYQTPMGLFRAQDGAVNIATPSQRMWERFCQSLGADDLFLHPDYQQAGDRIRHKARLNAAIEAVTARFTCAELVRRLNDVGVPCGPVNTVGEAFEDEQVKYLAMTKAAPHAELGDLALIRSPINLSAWPQGETFERAAPDPGQDKRAVLTSYGLAEGEIDELAALDLI